MQTKTIPLHKAPFKMLVHIVAYGGITLDTPVRGSFHKSNQPNLYLVHLGRGKGAELPGQTMVTYYEDPADICGRHGSPKEQWPGGVIHCNACNAEHQAVHKANRKAGVVGQGRLVAAIDRQEVAVKVAEAARLREVSTAQATGNLFRTIAMSGAYVKGSKAKKEASVRATMTQKAMELGITIQEAADLAGIDAWEPMTWSEYRKAYPRKQDVEVDA
jgi:hypothetical protein